MGGAVVVETKSTVVGVADGLVENSEGEGSSGNGVGESNCCCVGGGGWFGPLLELLLSSFPSSLEPPFPFPFPFPLPLFPPLFPSPFPLFPPPWLGLLSPPSLRLSDDSSTWLCRLLSLSSAFSRDCSIGAIAVFILCQALNGLCVNPPKREGCPACSRIFKR